MVDESPSEHVVRMARPEDLMRLVRHIRAQSRESGRGGSPHFAITRELDADAVRRGLEERWQRSLHEPLWGRAWLLWTAPIESDAARVVGHLELRGGQVPAELHRAVLGMGIQRAHTGQGHGRRLVEAAVAWARDEAGLDWIDLGVFANNEPARKLYARMGFVETGRMPDAFRIDDGQHVDDIHMSLRLRREAR